MRILATSALALAALAAPSGAVEADAPSIAAFTQTRTPPATARRGTGFPVARNVVAWRFAAPGWDDAIYLRVDGGIDKVHLSKDGSASRNAQVARSVLAEMRRYGPLEKAPGNGHKVTSTKGRVQAIVMHQGETSVSVGMALRRS